MRVTRDVLQVHNVHRTYDSGTVQVHALRGVSFRVTRGEMVAIMGPSGSGKSTLMHILGCLDRPTAGQYLIDDEDVSDRDDDQLAALRNQFLGFIFQEFNLLPGAPAIQNVMLPLTYRKMGQGERKKRALDALQQVDLGHRVDHKPSQLSGGQKQRVAVARSLATDPAILLADEPTGNLDTTSQDDLMQLLEELNAEGMTVVVVTHEEDVAVHCQRIVHLIDGEIISDSPVQEVMES